MSSMRHRSDSTSPSTPPLDSVFSPAFLDHLTERDEPLTAGEAEYAGPWKCEPVPGRPGAVAVLRAWEDLDRGDLAEGTFWHEETATLVAIALPLLSREPLFALSNEEEAEGFAVEAVYGEQGSQVSGWLRRHEPRVIEALHLLEGIVRSPAVLAALLEAAGPGAEAQVGRILARKL
jgi:hypothetical protein